MKNCCLILLMMIALLFAKFARADDAAFIAKSANISQQTGGNYIYAENGKLTFNFEPSVFEGRQWQYNASIDGAVTTFDLKQMPIKTKHSSTFYGYEITQNGELNLVAYYEEVRPPMLIKPVYRKGYEGRVVKVWLPQAAGWTVRVVGSLARAVVPPIFTNLAVKCMQNISLCSSLATGVGITVAKMCAINYASDGLIARIFRLPESVCKKAESEGWQKDKDGQYVRNYKYRAYVKFGRRPEPNCKPEEYSVCSPEFRELNIGSDTVEDLVKQLQAMCSRQENTDYTNRDESSSGVGLSGKIVKAEFKEHTKNKEYLCSTTARDELGEFESPGASFTATIEDDGHKEKLTFIDLANYVSEDFKKDPNPYINDKGELGKEIRKEIKSSSAIVKKDGSKGTLNLSSEPYKHPSTGETMQDVLSIESGKSWEIPPSAGGNDSSSGGGSGDGGNSGNGGSIPQGKNDVTVNSILRPDQSNNAKPAENNSPNGTGVSVVIGDNTGNNGSGSDNSQGSTGNGNSSGNQAASGARQDGLKCDEENKGALACASLGNIEENAFDGIEIPVKTDATTYQYDGFLPSSGMCPAPKTFHVVGKQFQVSYEPLCNFVSQIRFAVLIGFAITAAFIAFGGLKRG